MMIAPCWSCGSGAACFGGCECAKCLDPAGYDEWKNSEEYADWIQHQHELASEGYDPYLHGRVPFKSFKPPRRLDPRQYIQRKAVPVSQDSIDRIAELKRNAIPTRLEKGAEVLGRLWKAQIRCGGGWGQACPCGSAQTDFCKTKAKWLALLQEYHGGELPYGMTGQEENLIGILMLWEGLTGGILDVSGMTVMVDLGGRKPVKFGQKWTKLETLVQLQSMPLCPDRDQALEAVIKMQEVYAK
jgi:hypothetical protein